jgi:D-arabinose 1-dehydrogenase-like Zn-dependent alcohol dehydrogenase
MPEPGRGQVLVRVVACGPVTAMSHRRRWRTGSMLRWSGATSADAYQDAFRALKRNGTLLVVGIPSQALSWTAGEIIRSGARIAPSRVASRAELREIVRVAAENRIHSEIQTFSLEEIGSVMSRLSAGKIFGRAVIVPAGAPSNAPSGAPEPGRGNTESGRL